MSSQSVRKSGLLAYLSYLLTYKPGLENKKIWGLTYLLYLFTYLHTRARNKENLRAYLLT